MNITQQIHFEDCLGSSAVGKCKSSGISETMWLRKQLRQAKLIANAVPVLSTVPGSAGNAWTQHHKALANRRVRKIIKRMEKLGIDPDPQFFKPLPFRIPSKVETRLRRADDGWDGKRTGRDLLGLFFVPRGYTGVAFDPAQPVSIEKMADIGR